MFDLSEIPARPGLYALRDRNGDVAYVGISKNIRSRIDQHLYRRDSSIVTGVSTTALNPDYVTKVQWWLDPRLEDKVAREAAETIAFEKLNPALRSRGRPSAATADKLRDTAFVNEIEHLLARPPDGSHIPMNLVNLGKAVKRLEAEVEKLKRR